MTKYYRPFLKWAGGKYQLLSHLKPYIGDGTCLIEPFVGAGAVFLNTQFKRYILNDSNADLIHLYLTLQKEGTDFIDYAKQFYTAENNNAERYYNLRAQFNQSKPSREKSALFIYLNRHGYNGLCRYSQRTGFNVPFGSYIKPYFPQEEMLFFHKKSQHAKFVTGDFTPIMQKAKKNHVIYCDPPYIPLTASAYFTQYNKLGFNLEQQQQLATLAETLHQNGVKIILSNHDTPLTRKLYRNANHYKTVEIQRSISCKINQRSKAKEMIAVYT